MTYFRRLGTDMAGMCKCMTRDERWLIIINADPDAMGSAMALKRIMARRVAEVDIASINEIKRPDNLAMIRCLRIPLLPFSKNLAAKYDRFAIVDSQPHHNEAFAGRDYGIIIDHHPPGPDKPAEGAFVRIRPDYGSCSAILTEYLYNLKIRPGKLLATALLYGIKTDTQSFERHFTDADVKAFSYLHKYSSKLILQKIVHSEYKREWLKYFSRAFRKMLFVGKRGLFVYMGRLESPDILVILADFFTRVHGLSWDMLCGACEKKAVAIFRGDGLSGDMGKLAQKTFGDIGSAGGHKAMARAEIDIAKLEGEDPESFFYRRLTGSRLPAGFRDVKTP